MYSNQEIEKIFTEICKQISEEGKSIRKVLLQEGMPGSQAFYQWIDNDEVKSKQYASACSKRADVIFEDIIKIADTTQEGTTTKETDKGIEVTTGDMIQHRRLQVDARKWILSKMNPKKYGDSSLLKIGNENDNPFKVNAIFQKDILNVPANDSTKKNSKAN